MLKRVDKKVEKLLRKRKSEREADDQEGTKKKKS